VPLAIGRNRPAAGRALLAAHPQVDCLVCDDGLQHYALQRDVELVVIDRARGLGNGWLLPAGPLRESAGRLRDVSAVIIHGEAPVTRRARRLQQVLDRLPSVATLALTMQPPRALADGRSEAWPAWQGRTVHAVAGIGHPERFFAGLRQEGITVLAHPFPDHHAFSARDLQFAGHHPVLLTEKDAVKCGGLPGVDLWEVPLQSGLPSALLDQLSNQLESARGRKTA
jgi:tetraacyldisaccharide 4'-kinase